MNIFLDANVLVSVLNREYPVFQYSSRVLSLTEHPRFRLFTSPLCLGIAYYFSEKKSGKAAREKIALLASKIHISPIDEKTVKAAIANKKALDFEDAMQYYAAVYCGCKCIVSEDQHDFYFSEIPVFSCRQFMEQYVF